MYITQNWVCFYANIFTWETLVSIVTRQLSGYTDTESEIFTEDLISLASFTVEPYVSGHFGSHAVKIV